MAYITEDVLRKIALTSAERDALVVAGVVIAGDEIFNTTTNQPEWWDGSTWQSGGGANQIQLTNDLAGTPAAPIVKSSTQDLGLLVKDSGATKQFRMKPTGSAEASVRNAADDDYADLKAKSLTTTGGIDVGGDAVVNGNLTVKGATTTVDTQNVTVKDNIVDYNVGEPGVGVGNGTGQSGFQIDRGTGQPKAQMLWDEALQSFLSGLAGNLLAVARKYSGTLTLTALSHVITHNLSTKDVHVSVYNGDTLVQCGVQTTTANSVTLTFAKAVTGYRVVVTG